MKPSNTFRSDLRFGGVLQPLLNTLRRPTKKGALSGKEVMISRKGVSAIIAIDAENDTHLLISPETGNDPRLTKLDLRGLKIAGQDWSVSGMRPRRFLDVTCATGAAPSFKRPFLRFAEDVLFEISRPGTNPADAILRTYNRWRRFWSSENGEFTTEWLHGVFGELTFLEELIIRIGPDAVRCWNGPLGRDHDFQGGTKTAVEVKTSVVMPFSIHCNIRQLDPTIFKHLYIACYHLTPNEAADATLPDLVGRIEVALQNHDVELDLFFERLSAAGYRRELEDEYKKSHLQISPASVFLINESFPKITEKSFVAAPDHRISRIRYTLTLSGLESRPLSAVPDVHLRSLITGNG